ncbi:alpha/beta hydrolase [Rhizobium pusense]|uniref:alpha/beta hydrolase n=1 Tax=Agrobacterium pusense TaxID=648995 RepID=UPI001C6E0B2B|nr:alpha/beta hydrolase [Agrobacterium pusense]MBW9080713.1 alpha/beta hydrolase [Agrobacterium pusense]
MYDIGQGNRQGLSETFDLAAFQAQLDGIAKQRWAEVDGAPRLLVGATPQTLPESAGAVEREFFEYYGTPRGHHPRATPGFDRISNASMARFWSFDQLSWISPRPVLLVAGEHAHSRFFSEQADGFATDPKELFIVPGAGHVDLYDRVDLIPFDKLKSFFDQHLV